MARVRESYTARELSRVLGVGLRAIQKRAAREGWPCSEACNIRGGGAVKLFATVRLPDDVRAAVLLHEARALHGGAKATDRAAVDGNGLAEVGDARATGGEAGALGGNAEARGGKATAKGCDGIELSCSGHDMLCSGSALASNVGGPLVSMGGQGFAPPPLTPEQRREALARADLVRLYLDYQRTASRWGRRMQTKEDFVLLYNNGKYPQLLEVLGELSLKTLERHALQLRKSRDPLALADGRGKWRKGQSKVSDAQAAVLQRVALSPNRPTLATVIRVSRARMRSEDIPCEHVSDSTFRRYLQEFMRRHYPEWVFHREGEKALNEKCLFHIRRDYDLIQVGDLIVADGHILNFEVLSPWTGKPKRMVLIVWYDMKSNFAPGWEIMPTENTQAIASALRRAVMTLGKIPLVAYMDNGRAFRAKFFTETQDFRQAAIVGLFERLGMQVIFAWPYHAESKPVERFFGTFAELERLAPSFVGTSIDDKPPRLNRGERIHRALHDRSTGGYVPTLLEAHTAIAHWIDDYARRPQSGHLKGKCPLEVFEAGKGPGIDSAYEREQLRLLMMRREVRRIGRDGISLPWCPDKYYAPELYGRQMDSALVLYDLNDLSRIVVYDLDENLICEARRMDGVHPCATQLGSDEDREELRAQIELKRGLAKRTIGPAKRLLEQEILPEVKRITEEAGFARSAEAEGKPVTGGSRRQARVVSLPQCTREDRKLIERGCSDEELDRRMAEVRADADYVAVDPDAERQTREIMARMEADLEESTVTGPLRVFELPARAEAPQRSSRPYDGERPTFAFPIDRYSWCVERLGEGWTLGDDDVAFMARMEAGFDEETAEYWRIVRDAQAASDAERGAGS